MAEHSVEYEAHSSGLCRFGEAPEVLIRSEGRVYPHVVRRIVTVVRSRFEHRIQIDRRDAQRLYVIEFFFDPFETAAEHRPLDDSARIIAHVIRRLGPVLHDRSSHVAAPRVYVSVRSLDALPPAVVSGETVREYLVDYAVCVPLRHPRRSVCGYLIRRDLSLISEPPFAAGIRFVVSVIQAPDLSVLHHFYEESVP